VNLKEAYLMVERCKLARQLCWTVRRLIPFVEKGVLTLDEVKYICRSVAYVCKNVGCECWEYCLKASESESLKEFNVWCKKAQEGCRYADVHYELFVLPQSSGREENKKHEGVM